MDYIAEIKRLAGIEERAGLSRIVTHVVDGTPFIAISPEREYRSTSQNKLALQCMKTDLSKLPVGYIRQTGEWDGIPEQSLLIFPRAKHLPPDALDRFREMGIKLMKAYDQKAIVFSDGEKITMINQDGSVDDWGLDSVSFNSKKMADAGGNSRLHKKPYVFSPSDPDDSSTIGKNASRPRPATKST